MVGIKDTIHGMNSERVDAASEALGLGYSLHLISADIKGKKGCVRQIRIREFTSSYRDLG